MSLDKFEESFNSAIKKGLVPVSHEDYIEQTRIPSLRRWLHWLGYLRRDNGKAKIDPILVRGLEQFAIDAEIELKSNADDNAFIEQLWNPVREHTAFEREVGPEFIEESLESHNAAAKRAVHLRLFALGMCTEPPGEKMKLKNLKKGWENFKTAAYSLLLLDDLKEGKTAFQVLFNQDMILKQLGDDRESYNVRKPSSWSEKEKECIEKLVRKFLTGVARVELWLRGYDTGIATRQTDLTDGDNHPTLAVAMRHFWKDQKRENCRPANQWKTVDWLLFNTLLRLDGEAERRQQSEDSEAESLLEDSLHNSKSLKKLRKTYRSIFTVIWDGIKRATSWLFSLFRRTADALKQGIRNLARCIKKRVMQVAPAFTYMVKGLGISFGYLFKKRLPGSNPKLMVVEHDFDFDMKLYVDEAASDRSIQVFTNILRLMSRLLELSLDFLRMLLGFFKRVIRGTFTALGWFGAVLALFRFKRVVVVGRELSDRTRELIGYCEEAQEFVR